jgi:hypothetical protein
VELAGISAPVDVWVLGGLNDIDQLRPDQNISVVFARVDRFINSLRQLNPMNTAKFIRPPLPPKLTMLPNDSYILNPNKLSHLISFNDYLVTRNELDPD